MSLNHILLLFTLSTLALAGCTNDLKFSKGSEGGQGENPPGVCPLSSEVFVAPPSLVEVGQVLNLKYSQGEISWFIQKPDGSTVSLEGNDVSYTVADLGRHSGRAEVTYCGTVSVYNFLFDAFLPVTGGSIIINSGEQYTSLAGVSLSLLSIGATEMYITEDATCNSGGTWEVYSSQKAYTLVARNQSVNVYAKFRNPVGSVTSCVSDAILHDDIKPQVSIVGSPAIVTNQVNAQFNLSATDSGSGVDLYFCSLDAGQTTVCSETVNYTSLANGSHTFNTRVSDRAGNLSDWVQYTWTIDTVVPSLRFTQTPSNPSNVSLARFAFEGSDVGVGIDSYECRLDNGSYVACTSPTQFTVADGSHTYYVRLKDKAGNVSDPISYNWITDATAPVVTITSTPANPTKEVNAEFTFTVVDVSSSIRSIKCSLDNLAEVDCVSPIQYTNLTNGSHTFVVRAVDALGNSGSASYTWVVNDRMTDQIITIGEGANSADILFVVDNSESMFTELRESIPDRFRDFIQNLDGLDYNIGVTTSDARGSRPYEAGGLADILRTPAPGSGIALVPREKIISPLMPNASRNFIATIMRPEAICIQVGTHLCPQRASAFEEPIHSALLSLDRDDTQFFFRPGVPLHIVIISDTDEGANTYTYSNGTINNNAIPDHSRPETLIQRVQQKWPGKAFKVHSVVRRPNDRYCNASTSTNKAHIITMLTRATGGASANICNPSTMDRTEIKTISDAIGGGVQNSFALNCEPADLNGDGNVDKNDFAVSYNPQPNPVPDLVVSGSQVSFTPSLPANTSVSLRYQCK